MANADMKRRWWLSGGCMTYLMCVFMLFCTWMLLYIHLPPFEIKFWEHVVLRQKWIERWVEALREPLIVISCNASVARTRTQVLKPERVPHLRRRLHQRCPCMIFHCLSFKQHDDACDRNQKQEDLVCGPHWDRPDPICERWTFTVHVYRPAIVDG